MSPEYVTTRASGPNLPQVWAINKHIKMQVFRLTFYLFGLHDHGTFLGSRRARILGFEPLHLEVSRFEFARGDRTLNLPTEIIPTKIAWLKHSRKSPTGLGIPPLNFKIMLESNPLKSIIWVQRLALRQTFRRRNSLLRHFERLIAVALNYSPLLKTIIAGFLSRSRIVKDSSLGVE